MTYEIEACITCDACGAGMAYAQSKDDLWRAARVRLQRPRVSKRDGRVVHTAGGEKHICKNCENGGQSVDSKVIGAHYRALKRVLELATLPAGEGDRGE